MVSREGMLRAIDWVAERPWRVMVVVAGAVLLVTWFVQLVLLPHLVPQWHAGYGLIPGQDAVSFHRAAAEQAAAIRAEGWSAWELRPSGWGVSGLVSAWYAVTVSQPWAVAPVFALFYGLAAMLVAMLVAAVTDNRRMAVLAAAPAVLLPSAATLYAQIHRDLLVFFGLTVALYGFWLLCRAQREQGWSAARSLGFGLLLVPLGFLSAWAVREFSAEMFMGITALILALLLVLTLGRVIRFRRLSWPAVSAPFCAVVLLVAMDAFHDRQHFASSAPEVVVEVDEVDPDEVDEVKAPGWRSAAWLPSRADDMLRRLAGARVLFISGFGQARSALDTEVQYQSAEDILRYTPRAMQIGLFAPFPHQWAPHPEAPGHRNFFRLVAGAEMLVIYLVLPFLLYALWRWWRQPALWVMLLPAFSWVTVYALTVPAAGALVRYRYGAYLVLLALALAGLYAAIADVHRRWNTVRRERLAADAGSDE